MKYNPKKVSGHFPESYFKITHLASEGPWSGHGPGHFQETLFHQFPEHFLAFISEIVLFPWILVFHFVKSCYLMAGKFDDSAHLSWFRSFSAQTTFGPFEYSTQTINIHYSAQNDSAQRSTTLFDSPDNSELFCCLHYCTLPMKSYSNICPPIFQHFKYAAPNFMSK
jgi:hypothetical protein